jgi:hypothetical protein
MEARGASGHRWRWRGDQLGEFAQVLSRGGQEELDAQRSYFYCAPVALTLTASTLSRPFSRAKTCPRFPR